MKTKKPAPKRKTPKTTKPPRRLAAAPCSAIPAPKLLRAEAARLDVLKHGMPDAAEGIIAAQVWAYNLAAAFLDALGAPEKLVRYVPAPNTQLSDAQRSE